MLLKWTLSNISNASVWQLLSDSEDARSAIFRISFRYYRLLRLLFCCCMCESKCEAWRARSNILKLLSTFGSCVHWSIEILLWDWYLHQWWWWSSTFELSRSRSERRWWCKYFHWFWTNFLNLCVWRVDRVYYTRFRVGDLLCWWLVQFLSFVIDYHHTRLD